MNKKIKYNLGERFIARNFTTELPEGVFKVLLWENPLIPNLMNVSVVRFPYEWEKKQVPEETCIWPLAPYKEAEIKYWKESLVFAMAKNLDRFFQKEYRNKEKKQGKISSTTKTKFSSFNYETGLEKAVRIVALSDNRLEVDKSKKYLADFFLELYSKKGKNGEKSMLMGNSDESPEDYIKGVIDYLIEGHRTSQAEREESLKFFRDLNERYRLVS